MAHKPYRPKLKKVSRDELRLLDAVWSYLPATGMREGFLDGVRGVLAEEIGEGVSLRLESVVHEPFSKFAAKLPQHPLVAVLGLGPHGGKLLCEVDAELAMLAVERMLGGRAKSIPEPRELSDTEQGVMQYLLAKILSEVHRECRDAERAHFRFERFALTAEEAQTAVDEGTGCAVMAFRVTLGRHAGFVRVILPDPFIEQALMDVEAPGEERVQEQDWRRDAIGRFSYVRTSLWAEAGRTTLAPADLARLEVGDVILLEGGDLALSGGEMGRAVLRIGEGAIAGLDAEVSLDPDRVRASVSGIHRGD